MASRPRAAEGVLPYGNFGTPVYETETKEWQFERAELPPITLHLIGSPRVLHRSQPLGAPAESIPTAEHPGKRRRNQVGSLIRHCPEIQPASELLPRLLEISEAVGDVLAQHDPAKGGLISHGSILSEASRRAVPVVAHAAGLTGCDVRIVCQVSERRGWNHSKDAWLDVPIPAGEEVIWTYERAPVQQIVFSYSAEGKTSWLAVRMITKTGILRPILRSSVGTSGYSGRLDPGFLFEISIAQTGGVPHSDISFNPWYERQLAIIDQTGVCSFWEIQGRDRPRAEKLSSFTVRCEDQSRHDSPKFCADGWGRVCWVHHSTVVGCTRTEAVLIEIQEGTAVKVQTLPLDLKSGIGWIVDLCILPSQPNSCAILTSTNLTVFDFSPQVNGRLSVRELLNVRHYLDTGDIGLKITAFLDTHGLNFILQSGPRTMTMLYRGTISKSDGTISVSNPTIFNINMNAECPQISIENMHLGQTLIKGKNNGAGRSLLLPNEQRGVLFLAGTSLDSDFTLSQTLFCAIPTDVDSVEIQPPTWSARQNSISAVKTVRDNFVVEEVDGEDAVTRGYQAALIADDGERGIQPKRARSGQMWTVSYEHSMQDLQRGSPVRISDSLNLARNALMTEVTEYVDTSLMTLNEFTAGELEASDIEVASSQLDELKFSDPERHAMNDKEGLATNTRLVIRALNLPTIVSPGFDAEYMHLYPLYRTVVREWISPLPPNVPGRIRLTKDKFARGVAAEVVLASHVIRLPPNESLTQGKESTQQNSQSYSWEMPIRSNANDAFPAGSFDEADFDRGSDDGATPSGPPSILTTNSSIPSSSATPGMSRLACYVTLSKPLPQAPSRLLTRILAHWTPGTDPEQYDWINASRRMQRQEEEEEIDSQLTAKERARLQRRAERHLRRQRREAASSQAQQLASSQLPGLTISSGVVSQPAENLFQTQVGVSEVVETSPGFSSSNQVLSQIVPGRFAGRLPPRKKRKHGF